MSLVLECIPILSPQKQVSVGQFSSLGGILKKYQVLVVKIKGVAPLAFSDAG